MSAVAAGVHFNFRQRSGIPNPDIWRVLDHTVARWVIAHGGSRLLAEVAGWTSYAEGQGDGALPLQLDDNGRHGMRLLAADEIAALAAEPMVTAIDGDGEDEITTPFVMDLGHFYLRRNYLHERAVAAHIACRRAAASTPMTPMSETDLDVLFDCHRGNNVRSQREAVRRVLGRRLFVMTGGPGTGKTTTVLRMLLALGREHMARNDGPPVIRISAPTGKAAQRLSDSLRDGAMKLRSGQQLLPDAWTRHLDSALGAESGTLHRLLGSRRHGGGFAHHRDNRIPADVVVVDEASMVDLAMLRALLDALRDDTVLVLVGDADQLTSVGTGSVLLDLVAAMEADGGEDLVRLQHSFRAVTSLVPVNEAIRQGDFAAFERAWQAADGCAVRHAVVDRRELGLRLAAWSRDLRVRVQESGAFDAMPDDDPEAIRRALDALRRQQLLCALREGEFGAEQANDAIETSLRKGIEGHGNATWYPGRAVMISRNDYAYDLYNGDVGICLKDSQGGLRVWFDSAADAAEESASDTKPLRSFAPGSLPPHQCAFATTVHKSQGSEYERVAVLLPPEEDNAVLSRELLYTALTRARSRIELWATDGVVAATIALSIQRSAALRLRFTQRMPAGHA
jgi:exodeoxyribonuclease V alpha subunit